MIVTIDGRRVDAALPADVTLQNLIEHVRTEHVPDRLVISVAVNGQVLDDAALPGGLDESLAPDDQVDLESADRAALVTATLRELATEFERAGVGLTETANRLSSGETAAIREVGEFMRLWQTAYSALAQCSELLRRDLTDLPHDGRKARDFLTEMVGKLTEVRDALEARDLVLQADLVRYELPVLAATWQNLLTGLAEQIEAAT